MDDLIVYCRDCDLVEKHSRKQQTWGWLCTKFRRRPKGAISPEVLDVDPPFERCVDVNRFNNCNQFTPLKEPDDVHASSD
jgi:hypothetical protein